MHCTVIMDMKDPADYMSQCHDNNYFWLAYNNHATRILFTVVHGLLLYFFAVS
jgi:hypothetical protein